MTDIFSKITGIAGSIILLLGGLAMYIELPIIGQVTCMSCPTPGGILYIILAILSIIVIFAGMIRLLYVTGIIAGIVLLYDIYTATTVGQEVQALLLNVSSVPGWAAGAFSVAWVVIIGGVFLLLVSPLISKNVEKEEEVSPREASLNDTIADLNAIKKEYNSDDFLKNKFDSLLDELNGKK